MTTLLPLQALSLNSKALQKPFAWVLAGIVLVLIYQAGRIGVSDVYAYQAKRIIQSWEKNNKIYSLDEVTESLALIHKAQRLFPNYPEYLELEASIYQWKAFQQLEPLTAEEQYKLFNKALSLYKQSLQTQPTWPYAWRGIVDNKILLGQFDQELTDAIIYTIKYGGYEAGIQLGLLEVTFPRLARLEPKSRKAILDLYDRALQGNANIGHLIQLGRDKKIFLLRCLKPNLNDYARSVKRTCEQLLPKELINSQAQ